MHSRISTKKQEERVAALQKEVSDLQAALGTNVDAEKIVKNHIKLLHKYNEAKDATQIMIGKLAGLKETTVRELHKQYDLPESD